MAGLQRVKAQGKRLGRPQARIPFDKVKQVQQLPILEAAAALDVSESTMRRWSRACQKTSDNAA